MKLRQPYLIVLCGLLLATFLFSASRVSHPISANSNLLRNPGFEGPYSSWQPQLSTVQMAADWTPWWINDLNHVPVWVQPEYKPAEKRDYPARVYDGERAQQWFTFHRSHNAGIYQQVSGVTPGATYRFTAQLQVWSSSTDAAISERPALPYLQIGIDPTGAASPGSGSGAPSTVVWTDAPAIYDRWYALSIDVKAQASTITVYVRSNPNYAVKHNDIYIDAAELILVSNSGGSTPRPTNAPATARPTNAPATPRPTNAPATPRPTNAPATPRPTNAPAGGGQQPVSGNLLRNPGFEGPYSSWQPQLSTVQMAADWTPWWINDLNHVPVWVQPEYKPAEKRDYPARVYDGERAQQWFTFHRSHNAGIYQQVSGVTPGATYRFTAQLQVWSSSTDAAISERPALPYLQIGIDPTGAASPGSGSGAPSTVVWTDAPAIYDRWYALSIDVKAQASTITVYVRSNPNYAVKHNDIYIDAAQLVKLGNAPQPTATPGSGGGSGSDCTQPASGPWPCANPSGPWTPTPSAR